MSGFIVSGLGLTVASVVLDGASLVLPQNTSDFSFFVGDSGAAPIIVTAASLTNGVRNYLELSLTTEDNTPLSRVFWDPSLNSNNGAEFTQTVDTIVDLKVSVTVIQGGFSGSVDATPLAILDVNSSGVITSIFDRREIFGRLAGPGNPTNEHAWGAKIEPVYTLTLTGNTGTFVTGETLTLGHRQMVLTDASAVFTIGETIQDDTDATIQGVILSSSGTAPNITVEYYLTGAGLNDFTNATGAFTGQTSSATATAVTPTDIGNTGVVVTGGNTPITFNQPTGVQFFPETSNVSGATSGANGTIATISEAFAGVDKDLGTIEVVLQAMMTEIKKIKGTTFWYEDALKNLGNVDGSIVVGIGSGTANVQIIIATPAFINLDNGLRVTYKPTVTNTGGTTVTLDSFVPKAVLKYAQGVLVALEAGDLVSNVQADFVFVTQNDAFILLQPAQITDSQLSANVVLKDTASTISGVMTFGTNPVFNAGAIDSADIADGTIINDDINASAAIVDTKLATIASAGKVSDSALSSNVMLEDVANIATANQRINAGLGINIAPPATGNLAISGTFTAGSMNAARITSGTLPSPVIVPLARMGTSVLDSSTAVSANTETGITIQSVANLHRFYTRAIRGSSALFAYEGSKVNISESVDATSHSLIGRGSVTSADSLRLANGKSSSFTYIYKIYDLTET